MPMTVVVTRDVEMRYRGFLTSVMLEVAPGVYVAPGMSAGVRDRMWMVVTSSYAELHRGAIVLLWREPKAVGALRMESLGEPPKEIVDADGILLVKRR